MTVPRFPDFRCFQFGVNLRCSDKTVILCFTGLRNCSVAATFMFSSTSPLNLSHVGGSKAQRLDTWFSHSSPGFDSRHSQDFFSALLRTVDNNNIDNVNRTYLVMASGKKLLTFFFATKAV